MKKIFTLILSAFALCSAQVSAYNINICDQTGWTDTALYSWGDAEIFSGWPGAEASSTTVVNGLTFNVYPVDAQYDGNNQNLIFNGKSGASQMQLDDVNVTINADIYLVAKSYGMYVIDPQNYSEYSIFITDVDVNYLEKALYAWGDADIFGGWPGKQPVGVSEINGVNYNVFPLTADAIGKNVNLIYNNNNNGTQLPDYNVTLNGDLYLGAWETGLYVVDPNGEIQQPEVVYHYVYVDNQTSWANLYLYAYAPTGGPDLFGGWPGASPETTVVLNGVTYNGYKMQESTTTYVLMPNDNGSNKFENLTFVPDSDKYVQVTDAGNSWMAAPDEMEYALYIENKTGWDNLYVYAWGTSEFFGGWPGSAASGTVTKGDITYEKFVYFAKKDEAISMNVILNNNDGTQYDAKTINVAGDYYFTATASEMSGLENVAADDSALAPVYYNLSGVRVEKPQDGVFIEVRGTSARKLKF